MVPLQEVSFQEAVFPVAPSVQARRVWQAEWQSAGSAPLLESGWEAWIPALWDHPEWVPCCPQIRWAVWPPVFPQEQSAQWWAAPWLPSRGLSFRAVLWILYTLRLP